MKANAGWRSLGDSNPCFRRERATARAGQARSPDGAAILAILRTHGTTSSPSRTGDVCAPRRAP